MKVENVIHRRIKTVAIVKGEYPKEIEITQEEYEQLGKVDKFEGVKLKIKQERKI